MKKTTMLIVGLILVNQGYARFERESNASIAYENATPEQIAKMIYEKHPDLNKIHGLTSKEDIQMVKDILYTWDAPHNDFLKTPTTLTPKQEHDILRMLKRFKKYKNNRTSYVKAVERFMKKREGITDIERAYILFASGVKPDELSTNFTKYTGFWDTVKGHSYYKTKMYNIIDRWERTKNKYSF